MNIIIIIIIYLANLNEKTFLELFNLFDNFEMHVIIYILYFYYVSIKYYNILFTAINYDVPTL